MKINCNHPSNTHIKVGHNTMPIRCLWDIYGDKLCPGPLMPIRFGNARLYYCDQAHDLGHCSLFPSAHQLPPLCGPQDSNSWNKCLRASNQGVRQHKRNNGSDDDEDARVKVSEHQAERRRRLNKQLRVRRRSDRRCCNEAPCCQSAPL